MKKRKPQVQFYADNWLHQNKLYTFFVNDLQDAKNCVIRHMNKNWVVRAAFYREFNRSGVMRSNVKIYSINKGWE